MGAVIQKAAFHEVIVKVRAAVLSTAGLAGCVPRSSPAAREQERSDGRPPCS